MAFGDEREQRGRTERESAEKSKRKRDRMKNVAERKEGGRGPMHRQSKGFLRSRRDAVRGFFIV